MASTNSSLFESLNDMKYNPSDIRWVHFIQDHKNYLISNSETIVISENISNLYKYRPVDFLKSISVSFDMIWIIQFINDILEPMNFVNKSHIYKPTVKTISDLKIRYNTYFKKLSS